MDQIIDITTDGLHLSRARGVLKVSQDGTEIGRTPLDQIAGIIVHARGTTWSTALLTELGARGVPVVLCDAAHRPQSVLMPLEGHHAQGGRIRAQWNAKAPMLKQAWKRIVLCKIGMQAAALAMTGAPNAPLDMMARKVTSGDTTNQEAQAARYYWPLMMGGGVSPRQQQGRGRQCPAELRLHSPAGGCVAGGCGGRAAPFGRVAPFQSGQCVRAVR